MPTKSEPSSPTLSSTSSTSTERTNSLIITQLPPAFFQKLVLDVLRDHFSIYGEIHQWVPLSSFGRIIVVYRHEDDAEKAKLQCDPLVLEASADRPETILRVFRSAHTNLVVDNQHLRPPAIEKNFLISPPGSPPVGWEPIKEDPPNATPLADDLVIALQKLALRHGKRQSREMLLEPEDGVGVGVYVEDCDVEDGEEIEEIDWVYGENGPSRMRYAPIPTALPPMRMAVS